MTNYTLERNITNDGNWEHYADLGCDETTAIEMWHYWQEKQPNSRFRMYKVTKELVAMNTQDLTREESYSVEAVYQNDQIIGLTRS